MSYHIYTTDGIILKSKAFGEADVLLHVLTRDFGLIVASARSARLSASKLKPSLQEYSYVSISCVKGKNGWKVTNVSSKGSFFFDYPKASHEVLAKIVLVLLKMMPGESPHPEVFDTVKSAFKFLKSVETQNISNFEALAVLRVLYLLGYVEKNSAQVFLENMEWNLSLLEEISKEKEKIVSLINKALKESHL